MADLKTLRVCLSSELPTEVNRSYDYIYFTYDKLGLYLGQNEYYDNFVVAESMPETPVEGIIYLIYSDGSAHRYIDYSDIKIAEIEDASQIELLKQAGTVFAVNANRRYFDSQQRTLTLPFNNGIYELAVSARNDQMYTNDTIMKYNTDKERFEIYGPSSEEFIDFSKPFRGGKSSTVEINVDNHRLQGNVRISKMLDNILRSTSDGLYAITKNKVDKDTFNDFIKSTSEFKKYAQDVLNNLSGEIEAIEGLISEQAIDEKIMKVLTERFSDIEHGLAMYSEIYDSLTRIETEVMMYATTTIASNRQEILDKIEWDDLDDSAESYVSEIDYYNKSEEYYKPHQITYEEMQIIFAAAIQMYINDTTNNGGNE